MTMIFVTTDQEEALSLSDRIAVMKQGCIVQNGTRKKFIMNRQMKKLPPLLGKQIRTFYARRSCFDRRSCRFLYDSGAAVYGSHTEYLVTDGERNWQVSMFGQAGAASILE